MSLQLRLKKGGDGRVASFALHRADGSVTVMRSINPFFPIHDLTHYAVESTFRLRQGFYGLVSDGWDFDDFGTPWRRGAMPADRDPAEEVVGLLDLERATGVLMDVDDVNEQLRAFAAAHPLAPALVVTQELLDVVRERVRGYSARWHALPSGETLVLDYVPGADRQP